MSYQKLIAEHARIDTLLDAMRELTAMSAPDVPAVVLGLSMLSEELRHHLAHEDSFIYPRMIAQGTPESIRSANLFVRDFAALRADWMLYLGEWNAECIAADWSGFRAATQLMIERLADRVRAENELIYNVALQHSIIPLRDAA